MSTEVQQAGAADQRSLAARLAPLLNESCDNRLGSIDWFRADWQRGGAATGTSTFRNDDGTEARVVLKLPVVQRELRWTVRLQPAEGDEPNVVPRLYGHGLSLGDYDLGWLVMERFDHGPLGLHWHEDHIARVADAAARFQAAAAAFPANQPPVVEPWEELIREALKNVKLNPIEEDQRWTKSLKALLQRLDPLVTEWRGRDAAQWVHGDLHFANAMSRVGNDEGPVCLIDLAEVHAGHWLEDAVFLERQLWARPERMKKHKPVKLLAAARRRLGLPVEDEYSRLAMIRRALLAATAPKFLKSEGHPRHLAACLSWLERSLAEIG